MKNDFSHINNFYDRCNIFIAVIFIIVALFLFAGCRTAKQERDKTYSTAQESFLDSQLEVLNNGQTPGATLTELEQFQTKSPNSNIFKRLFTPGTTTARKYKDKRHITINVNSGNKDKSEVTIKNKTDNSISDKAKGSATKVQGDGNTTTVTPPNKSISPVTIIAIIACIYGLYKLLPWLFRVVRKFINPLS